MVDFSHDDVHVLQLNFVVAVCNLFARQCPPLRSLHFPVRTTQRLIFESKGQLRCKTH